MDIKKTLDEKLSKVSDKELIDYVKDNQEFYELNKDRAVSTDVYIMLAIYKAYIQEIKKRGLHYE